MVNEEVIPNIDPAYAVKWLKTRPSFSALHIPSSHGMMTHALTPSRPSHLASLSMKIRIGQYAFSIGSPFRPGHVLNQNEADALNGLRAENIRNNVKKMVDRATQSLPPASILNPDELASLQEEVLDYARTYSFGERREPKGGIRKTAFEQELRSVAEERISTQQRSVDVELSSEAFDLAVEQQMQLAPVIDEARQRVAKRQELAKEALADL